MSRQLQPCGTQAAYNRHRYHNEIPCELCRKANTESTKRRSVYAKTVAKSRALTRLARRYPDEFEQILAEELAYERRRQ